MEAKGVEAYISGETSESTVHKMKESGISYFVCGHYATEKFGVQALGDIIKTNFKDKLEVKFIDVENPI
jgi:putative NIF3 family GTP cyclohydrolase 1 type 2